MSKKNDGGLVYPAQRLEGIIGELGKSIEHVDYPGITRRNKLIDDLVVGIAVGFIAKDRNIITLRENCRKITNAAIEIADATTKDIPLPQYWGKDYARKKKMHDRMIKTKLKKP